MDITIPYYEDNSRISNSSLGWFKTSPKYFKGRLDGTIDFKGTSAMDFGTMVHAYLLQPEEFKSLYKIKDIEIPSSKQQKDFASDYLKSKANTVILKAVDAFKANYSTSGKSDDKIATEALKMALNLKSYIQYLKSQEKTSDNRQFISWSQYNNLKVIKENIMLHKKAKELLFNIESSDDIIAQNEFHINWQYPNELKTECKSLLDRFVLNKQTKQIFLIDIKTTGDVNNFGSKSFVDYDYGRQMSFYWHAIYWYLKNELGFTDDDLDTYTKETFIVAIQTSGQFDVKVFKVPDDIIDIKITEIKEIISNINWHMSNDKWDYSKDYYEGDGSEPL